MVTQTCGWAQADAPAARRPAKAKIIRTKYLVMSEAKPIAAENCESPAPESRPRQHSTECGGMEAPNCGSDRGFGRGSKPNMKRNFTARRRPRRRADRGRP